MNTDSLFKELEPPRGGAERFAQRLDEAAAERRSPRMRAVALAASVAIVTTVLLRPASETSEPTVADTLPAVEVYNAPEFDRLLGRVSPRAELTVVVNTESARVTELETTSAKVRIYQIN